MASGTTKTLLPDSSAGRYRQPAGSCDVHAHVYGPFARFPLAGERKTSEAPLEAYERMRAALGFDRGVIIQPSDYGIDNACLLDALARTGPSVKGTVVLDAAALTDTELARLEELRVCGVRVSARAPVGPKLSDLEALDERLAGRRWHLELVPPNAIEPLVALRPRLERMRIPVVFDQLGCPDPARGIEDPSFQSLLAMLRDGLIWVKMSHVYRFGAFPYAEVQRFARALAEANPKRCLFSIDWPHVRAQEYEAVPSDGFLLDLFAEWFPGESLRRQILVDNPAELYGF